ncbi:MAG: class I SAM-dependent methyltransferase [Proteobacteria bacterium]|nr:class I SAM-dependent methyltransferase [Pseudomonadota bacterium]
MKRIKNQKETVISQFNLQAQNFDDWSITQNRNELQSFFDFSKLDKNDDLLELACGTGSFSLLAAEKLRSVTGVDITQKMISFGQQKADAMGLTNIKFICHDAEILPFSDDTYSATVCKSALHHMEEFEKVIAEMIRCTKPGGKISVQDITAYEDEYVNTYFEKLEKKIDASHYITLTKSQIFNCFNKVKIQGLFERFNDLNLHDYIGHAIQDKKNGRELAAHIELGLSDKRISEYLIRKTKISILEEKFLLYRESLTNKGDGDGKRSGDSETKN